MRWEKNGSLVKFIFNPDREAVVEESSSSLTRYIRSSELIARNTDAARTYYHYVSDEIGSTTHIVDEDGIILNHYTYDAWGNLTAQEEAVPNRFKFTGQQLDPVTQRYYLHARFYNPVIARFLQEDTYRGDGLNLCTHIGHTFGNEFWRLRDLAESQGLIQNEFNKVINRHPKFYQYEDSLRNISYMYEDKSPLNFNRIIN